MNGLPRFFQMIFSILDTTIHFLRAPMSRMKLARVFIRITMTLAVMGLAATGSVSAQWSAASSNYFRLAGAAKRQTADMILSNQTQKIRAVNAGGLGARCDIALILGEQTVNVLFFKVANRTKLCFAKGLEFCRVCLTV